MGRDTGTEDHSPRMWPLFVVMALSLCVTAGTLWWSATDHSSPREPIAHTQQVIPEDAQKARDHIIGDPTAPSSDLEATAVQTMAHLYSFQPAEYASRRENQRATALPYLTGDFKRNVDQGSPGVKETLPSDLWQAWARGKDIIVATAHVEDTQVVDDSHAQVTVHTRQTVQMGQGGSTALTPFEAQLLMVKDADGIWHAEGIAITEGAPTY